MPYWPTAHSEHRFGFHATRADYVSVPADFQANFGRDSTGASSILFLEPVVILAPPIGSCAELCHAGLRSGGLLALPCEGRGRSPRSPPSGGVFILIQFTANVEVHGGQVLRLFIPSADFPRDESRILHHRRTADEMLPTDSEQRTGRIPNFLELRNNPSSEMSTCLVWKARAAPGEADRAVSRAAGYALCRRLSRQRQPFQRPPSQGHACQ